MSDTLIKVEGVSKKFCRSLKRSLWYGMQDLGNELLGRRHSGHGELRQDEFWAVKDVSFELKRGECLGLIGHNGAGKTTILRIINGLIKPDQGRIKMTGKVGALIALGAGFNPILTGRENIYVNASVLGLRKREIDEKIEEIIEFAEIGDFVDSPVQNYSSGMMVRLGFSIATTLSPDIMILDEVLAVGDLHFQKKCTERMLQLIKDGDRSIIMVGHNIRQVQRISSRMILLSRGQIIAEGDPVKVTEVFFEEMEGAIDTQQSISYSSNIQSTGEVLINSIEIIDQNGQLTSLVLMGEDVIVRLKFTVIKSVCDLEVAVGINTTDQIYIATESSGRDELMSFLPGQYILDVTFLKLSLLPGEYSLRLFFHHTLGVNFVSGEDVTRFHVSAGHRNRVDLSAVSLVKFPTTWSLEHVD
jgi:homopolymeric O-antigen transport system ATP-binding protein